MKCPQCAYQLREVKYEGVNIHTCPSCGGEFIGADELAHIVQTREQRFPADLKSEVKARQPHFGPPTESKGQQLVCPACEETMSVINYAGDTGVFLDRCTHCGGVWLDRNELEHIQILTERWADEAPQQLQQIAGELEDARRKAAEQSDAGFAGSRFAFVNALINRLVDAA